MVPYDPQKNHRTNVTPRFPRDTADKSDLLHELLGGDDAPQATPKTIHRSAEIHLGAKKGDDAPTAGASAAETAPAVAAAAPAAPTVPAELTVPIDEEADEELVRACVRSWSPVFQIPVTFFFLHLLFMHAYVVLFRFTVSVRVPDHNR
jgi:hypothetical protein